VTCSIAHSLGRQKTDAAKRLGDDLYGVEVVGA
jgi:hypothetical protein